MLLKKPVNPEITHKILRVGYGKLRVDYGEITGRPLPSFFFYGLPPRYNQVFPPITRLSVTAKPGCSRYGLLRVEVP